MRITAGAVHGPREYLRQPRYISLPPWSGSAFNNALLAAVIRYGRVISPIAVILICAFLILRRDDISEVTAVMVLTLVVIGIMVIMLLQYRRRQS